MWKRRAFRAIGSTFDSCLVTHAIVIGDSNFEIDAAQSLSKLFDHVKIKTIKLQRRPSAAQLRSELVSISSKLVWLSQHEMSLAFEFAA